MQTHVLAANVEIPEHIPISVGFVEHLPHVPNFLHFSDYADLYRDGSAYLRTFLSEIYERGPKKC